MENVYACGREWGGAEASISGSESQWAVESGWLPGGGGNRLSCSEQQKQLMLCQCPFMPGSHSLLLFDPCQRGGTVAVPISQMRRVRLPDSEMRSTSRSQGAGVWTEPPLAATMLSLTLCASWTLPPRSRVCCSPRSPAVLPPGGSAGSSPRLRTEEHFPADKPPPSSRAPRAPVLPPPPVLLADFTSTFWVLPAEPMPPLHPPAQWPRPRSVSR